MGAVNFKVRLWCIQCCSAKGLNNLYLKWILLYVEFAMVESLEDSEWLICCCVLCCRFQTLLKILFSMLLPMFNDKVILLTLNMILYPYSCFSPLFYYHILTNFALEWRPLTGPLSLLSRQHLYTVYISIWWKMSFVSAQVLLLEFIGFDFYKTRSLGLFYHFNYFVVK